MAIDIIQGDCIEVLQTIPAQSVDCVLTDLPYGTTQNKWDSIIPLDALWTAWRRICKPGAPVILFAQQPFTTTLAASNLKNLRTEWIWTKSQGTGQLNAKRYPLKQHENVLVFCDRRPPYYPQFSTGHRPYLCRGSNYSPNYGSQRIVDRKSEGTRYPTTVLNFPRDRKKFHPTQKPIALVEYLIRTYTLPGDLILDCTAGSGTRLSLPSDRRDPASPSSCPKITVRSLATEWTQIRTSSNST